MKCKDIEIRIVENITESDTLSAAESAHINSCSSCKAYLADMTAIFLEETEHVVEPSDAYYNQLWASVEPRLEKQGNFLRFLQMPIVMQTIAAVVLIGAGFFASTWFESSNQQIEYKKPDLQLVRFMQQSQIAITSFANMDEYEQVEMLGVLTATADTLLSTTVTLKNKYADDEELSEMLSSLERILTMLSSMKDKSAATVRSFQYGVQNRNLVEKIDQLSI
jgi:flagellar basal body-associated protein FliL